MPARTYVKSYAVISGATRTSVVTVEPADGKVLVVSRDGNRAPHLDRRSSGAPAELAREIGVDLLGDGYVLTA